jgi:hypothetical protein
MECGYFWWLGFFPLEGFPRVYIMSYLIDMLSILLHMDFECLFSLLSLLGYVEIVIIWLEVSLIETNDEVF